MSSISHSTTITWCTCACVGLADQHAQHVRRLAEVAMRPRRSRRRRSRIAGNGPNEAACAVSSSAPVGVSSSASRAAREDRRVAEQAHRRRRRHREHAVRRVDHPAADVQRRADDAVGLEPVEREHRADDVDDRVERADLVQVHALDRHLVDGRFGLRQPLEQGLGAVLPCRRQRGPVDVGKDFREASVRVPWCVGCARCVGARWCAGARGVP